MRKCIAARNSDHRSDHAENHRLDKDEREDGSPLGPQGDDDGQIASALGDGCRARVVDDEDAREEAEEAQAIQHRLKGADHALEALAPKSGTRHAERGGQLVRQPPCQGGHVAPRPHENVDLVHSPILADEPLCGGEVHDRQVATKDGGDALGTKQAADVQLTNAARRREPYTVAHGDVAPSRVLLGEEDRGGVVE